MSHLFVEMRDAFLDLRASIIGYDNHSLEITSRLPLESMEDFQSLEVSLREEKISSAFVS
jgi:hypothetical protein